MKKAIIAMSGGVDSSVAALMTLKEGYEAEGVTLKLFETRENACCSERDIADAAAVCKKLGIKHTVLEYGEAFERFVVKKFASVYIEGGTPNPCIECNRYVKFAAISEYADSAGADIIVTGHYAVSEKDSETDRTLQSRTLQSRTLQSRTLLKRAADRHKDQSYVLYRLTQEQLSRCRFPLGSYTKPEIRKIAAEAGFITADKKDSQDICFIKDGDYRGFLRHYTGLDFPDGDFVTTDGKIPGRHEGLPCYTVGQRKGLNIAWAYPLYVIRKDAESNTVILGKEEELYTKELTATRLNFIPFDRLTSPMKVTAKTRYSQSEAEAMIIPIGDDAVKAIFTSPQRAITVGQSAVFYNGDTVIGGGEITDSTV